MNKKIENFKLKSNQKIAIVASCYYQSIYENLLKGALTELSRYDAITEIFNVEGALEIPTAINLLKKNFEGFIALGCVIRGETSHYDIVASNSAYALSKLGLDNICIGNGIVTVDTIDQAIARSDPNLKNKGKFAVKALMSLLLIKQKYRISS